MYFTGHIEVYQSSYMLFQNENKFLLIRDTEETKNKEVVFYGQKAVALSDIFS